MDDTAQSRASDVASAATRKRRSSILKSQRATRTPFCELEFNVATPTDTTKSRRVSFSRRTGVAEFITNEGTTTWKNFYEEHNKSLESSGNESAMHQAKQPIAHLGKRIFDQQFEEVEAVDFIGLNPGINMSTSINNIKFGLDNTDNKITAPQTNFELSAFTETQSKLFADDIAITCGGEETGRIDLNFSAIQQLGDKDDLDEIQKDLERQSNGGCQGPFSGQNLSEYIEVDLDVTHAAIVNEESDMSITDTIHSPKVQEISKNCSVEKKVNLSGKDWTLDKENLPVNPYVAPRESLNFAVNEEQDKVLVFDGKKLVVEMENPQENLPKSARNIPNHIPQRKTIVLNCNDDLPNFLEEPQTSKNTSYFVSEFQPSMIMEDKSSSHNNKSINKNRTVIYDDFSEISITQAVDNAVRPFADKRRTVVYDDDVPNLSITQALPAKIIDNEKRKTIVYDNANISITQAVPNVLISGEKTEKRRTIVFENDACNISMTQMIPTNIVSDKSANAKTNSFVENNSFNIINSIHKPKDSGRIVVYDESDNISVTQCVPPNKNLERRGTVVFDEEVCNISVTQALPSNIFAQKFNATTFENDANISMTQAVPANILLGSAEPNRRRTVVFEDGNLSITQAVSKNQVIQDLKHLEERLMSSRAENKYFNDVILPNTDEDYNMSLTKAACSEHILGQVKNTLSEDTRNKRRTVVFENDDGNISITQAVPITEVIKNIQYQKQKELDDSIEATKVALHQKNIGNTSRTVVYEDNDGDISLTQALPTKSVFDLVQQDKHIDTNHSLNPNATTKRRTCVFEGDDADISTTQAIPTNVIEAICNQDTKRSIPISEVNTHVDDNIKIEATTVALHLMGSCNNRRRTVVYEDDDGDVSMTETVPITQIIETVKMNKQDVDKKDTDKGRTVVVENENTDTSMTQAGALKKITDTKKVTQQDIPNRYSATKQRTVIVENKYADISSSTMMYDRVFDNRHTLNIELVDIPKTDKKNITNTVVLDDNCDVSMTHASDVNQILPGVSHVISHKLSFSVDIIDKQKIIYDDEEMHLVTETDSSSTELVNEPEKKPTIRLEGRNMVLQNQDILMDTDNFNEGDNIEKKDCDISMIDVSEIHQPQAKAIALGENSDKCISNNSTSTVDVHDKLITSIPVKLLQEDSQNKSISKISRDHDIIKNNTKYTITPSDVVVYQSITINTEILQRESNKEDQKLREDETDINMDNITIENKKLTNTNVPKCRQKSAILNNLLDMSQSSYDDIVRNDKFFKTSNENKIEDIERTHTEESESNMFLVTNDTYDDVLESKLKVPTNTGFNDRQIDKTDISSDTLAGKQNVSEENLSITVENKVKSKQTMSCKEDPKKSNVQDDLREEVHPQQDPDENVVTTDILKRKSFKSADDTRELLDMITDITDKRISRIPEDIKEIEEECEPAQGKMSLDHKIDTKSMMLQLNHTLKRQSVALSREDLMNNLSMASALLQRTLSDDEIESEEEATPTLNVSQQKSVRVSTDIVKQLHFEDSVSEKHEDNQTPLRKTAFGEVSYMKEPKSKVIPDFLTTSDGVKELMDDLVKPSNDVVFTSTSLDRSIKQKPMTNSTEVQANLQTSSQVDLQTDLYSTTTDSTYDFNKTSSLDTFSDVVNVPASQTTKNPSDMINANSNKTERQVSPHSKSYTNGSVLIFDHSNPLNNVLLAAPAPQAVDIHKYSPLKPLQPELPSVPSTDVKEEGVSNQYHVEVKDTFTTNIEDNQSTTSSAIKPMSVDECTEPECLEVKDEKVNTDIAMKGNKELLGANSSLTLVDETTDSYVNLKSESNRHSPDTVVYQAEDLDMTSTDEAEKSQIKSKKRIYSPAKSHQDTSVIEVTPKPASKLQKRSYPGTDPKNSEPIHTEHKSPEHKKSPERKKSPNKCKDKKPLTAVTVQQMTTVVGKECQMEITDSSSEPQSVCMSDVPISAPSSEVVSSCNSSNNLRQDSSRTIFTNPSSTNSEWWPETVSSASSSSVDVVAMIDAMPFMGGQDCQWESVGRCVWNLLLLHCRLRLTMRFADTPRVAPHTPVLSAELEILQKDKKNSIAYLCVCACAELVRHQLSRAGDARRLVGRAGAAAQLAARWARAMHRARCRLAYTLTSDGCLSLKVANTSVRAVWEVSLRVETVISAAGGAPWPRACDVRVRSVAGPPPPDVARLADSVPHDWGHVPNTIWKIFRYLKNKKQDDIDLRL